MRSLQDVAERGDLLRGIKIGETANRAVNAFRDKAPRVGRESAIAEGVILVRNGNRVSRHQRIAVGALGRIPTTRLGHVSGCQDVVICKLIARERLTAVADFRRLEQIK